ncbi:Chemotaxis protein CheA [Planctomycetes bacterium Poly30]|uniref:histidine kinase n=1 Tax=Saltatorellus ferox TaxID=2528018 RepID=A0A518F0T1_9BACT|nr:Chemotaxis protein CheA [Planctomycetes bacterium Poly30]
MSELDEIVREFVVESLEGLDLVDAELLKLEADPEDEQTLQSIFRTIHSMKGACGFLEFSVLESVAHAGENLLDALREGEIALDKGLITTLLEMNDAIRSLLGTIQDSGSHTDAGDFGSLVARLHESLDQATAETMEAASTPDLEAAVVAEEEAPSVEPPSSEGDLEGAAPVPEAIDSPTPAKKKPVTTKASSAFPVVAKKPESATKADADITESSGAQAAKSASESSIRLRVDQLDALMNLAGELVLARNQVVQNSSDTEDSAAHATAQRLSRITTELQEGIMKIRMQPIGTLWSKLPRVVRGMSMQLEKEVELKMIGSDTEVDKTLLEAIKDPLTHLVRNSLDHGIEKPDQREAKGKPRIATLTLSAFHESGQVNIVVRDNGRGIDPEIIKAKAVERGLITAMEAVRMDDRAALDILFMPGFSTAEQVTSISGRGVGMDVVKRNLECVGGTVEIESEMGSGTAVVVRIPLTLAIIPALTVHSGGNRYAIPQANLVELLRVGPESAVGIEEVFGQRVFRLRGDLLHLVDLNEQLGTESTN